MNKKRGFTLVELLIVMTILITFALLGGLMNAIAAVNKGKDAQIKKDLKAIKGAFEEYYNDKETFPLDINAWNIDSNCNTDVFKPYLNFWLCDPNGRVYKIFVEKNKFRIVANLKNKKDKDIPKTWDGVTGYFLNGNYGVSSTNILWYDP